MAVVLRFSDYNFDTFSEHESIRSQFGHVWWGWWKKKHEVYPAATVRTLVESTNGGAITLGLVNRQGVYLAATVNRVAEAAGAPLPSPEPGRTPGYYAHEAFPLWLRIVAFTELTEGQWIDSFGPVPVGDDTFFSEGEKGGIEVVRVEEPDGSGILHISDLHFGADYGFGKKALVAISEPLEKRIADALPCRPAAIVVSGDLTTRGDGAGLIEARIFLEKLAEKVGIARDRVVIAPGNHDILVDSSTVTRSFANEQQFRDQMEEFYQRDSVELERIHVLSGQDGVDYVFVAVNSSRPRTFETMDFGYVGRDRSEPIILEAKSIRAEMTGSVWMCLVLHHHILPGQQVVYAEPDRQVSLAIDAGELVSLTSRNEFDAILHGHEHIPFVGNTTRIAEFDGHVDGAVHEGRQLLVLAAGSAGVITSRLSPELPFNSFNFYDIAADDVRVRLFRFNEKIAPSCQGSWDFRIGRHGG